MSDKRTHTSDCDWHVDQYPWECTCGFIPRKKAMDNLIAQDADLIVLDDPGFNKPANTLVRDMSRAIHKVLSKDNIDAYLMMSRDVAGDAARSVLPFIKADRIEALEAENERLVADNEQWQVDYNEVVFEKLELLAVLGEMTPDYEMLVNQSWDDGAIWSWVKKAKGIAAKARAALGKK